MPYPPIVAIVDDDHGVRASLSSLMRSLGYAVRSYGSAVEFLGDTAGGDPDCMLTDIQMPGMTGDQLQAHLIAQGRIFPMIFMTAFPEGGIEQRVMAAGAHCFLAKPADADLIASCVASALGGES